MARSAANIVLGDDARALDVRREKETADPRPPLDGLFARDGRRSSPKRGGSRDGWSRRRRVIAILRLAHRRLGMRRWRGVGALGRGAAAAVAIAAMGMASDALAGEAL